MSRRVRLSLGVAGSACLLLALLPYYSHTAGPAAHSEVEAIELPGLGTVPLEPSKTVVRLGLPFSPLFVYLREAIFEPQPGSAPVSVNGGEVKIDFTGEIGFTHNWHFGFFSWSFALALLGVGLLAIVRNRSRARPDVVGGG